MKILSRTIAMTFAASLSLAAGPALADQADKDACADLDEGDDCTRGDGDAGVCTPDESDPDVLTCDDDSTGGGGTGASGSGSGNHSGGGCSTSGGTPSPLPFALTSLAALAWSRRKLARG